MHPASKVLLYSLLGLGALVGGLFLLALGPLGWVVAIVLVAVVAFAAWRDEELGEIDRVNCAACGSPNDAEAETCRYCGEAL